MATSLKKTPSMTPLNLAVVEMRRNSIVAPLQVKMHLLRLKMEMSCFGVTSRTGLAPRFFNDLLYKLGGGAVVEKMLMIPNMSKRN